MKDSPSTKKVATGCTEMHDHYSLNITIPCQSGNLEGRIQYKEEKEDQTGVILCPPHPLLAGNMDNNVIQCLADTLAQHCTVLSFNYRNVGKSFKPKGDLPLFEYWDQLDQQHDFECIIKDTRDVLDWSKRFFTSFHLIGYSFGAFIALSAQTKNSLSFTGITPPLAEHQFNVATLSCPSLFIFAEQDNLLGQCKTELPDTASILEIKDCDHFFIQREKEICTLIQSFVL